MGEQANVVDKKRGYALWLPTKTPGGQEVSLLMREQDGIHIRHVESSDQSELYFEVAAYPEILDHEPLIARQQRFLREAGPEGQITAAGRGTVAGYSGTTFAFRGLLQGQWKERRFFFIDGPRRTYRIVYDPTSTANERVAAGLELIAED